tara:strand:- start:117 stop:284 length:168 start_codon:yes stop_codon:yes gene_type:complete
MGTLVYNCFVRNVDIAALWSIAPLLFLDEFVRFRLLTAGETMELTAETVLGVARD